jgi:AcrR family transcriptional regulator
METETKERILQAALDLFAIHGFSTVSVRDIGRAVGIKVSSLYYHFKNKDDILNTLLERAEQEAELRKAQFVQVLAAAPRVDLEGFLAAGIAYVENYLLEPQISPFIRMLTLEKLHNPDAAALYHRLLFTVPLEHQQRMFPI